MLNKIIAIIFATFIAFILIMELFEYIESENYVTEDVKFTGVVTKQYITEIVTGKYAKTTIEYYTVVDCSGNPEVIKDYSYYIKHNIGDEVELVKRRTYDEDGNWISTEVKWR